MPFDRAVTQPAARIKTQNLHAARKQFRAVFCGAHASRVSFFASPRKTVPKHTNASSTANGASHVLAAINGGAKSTIAGAVRVVAGGKPEGDSTAKANAYGAIASGETHSFVNLTPKIEATVSGAEAQPYLLLLGATLVLALTFAPWATAAALRISVE